MKVHHIGYLTTSIPEGIENLKLLGYCVEHDIIRDDKRGIDIVFLVNSENSGGMRIELICPYTEDSVVHGMLKKSIKGPYHICYECNNFEDDVNKLMSLNYKMCQKPEEAIALDNKKVCFLINKDIGIIELLER